MMKKMLLPLLIVTLIPLMGFYTGSNEDWRLQKEKNNIRVYSKSSSNSTERHLRAEAEVNTSLSSLVAMISDVHLYPKWVYRCSEAKLLKQINEREFYYYQITHVPWPIPNRDMVIHVKINQDEETGKVLVSLKGVPDFIPENENLVRVRIFEGQWEFIPQSSGVVKVTHQFLIDPKGDVPGWLVEMAAVDGPMNTMESMIQLKSDKAFANRSFAFIKDPV
jgi:ribosome-associated toxin RatA of RatAB toxin-antitoxin module